MAERRDVNGRVVWHQVTYAETFGAVQAIGQALIERDLSPERPVVILSGNGLDHALVALAAMHVGVPVVPVSPSYSLASRTLAKLRHILDLVTPGLIFVSNWERFAPALRAVSPRAEIVTAKAPADETRATPLAELRATPAGPAVESANARVRPDTVAKVLFSSGSTGLPKGVITTQRMMCSNQAAVAQLWHFLQDSPPILVDWLPWHHTFGGSFCFNLVLYHGGTIYIDDGMPTSRLIGRTLANLREISPTLYLNVPLGYDMLLPHLERDPALSKRFFARLNGMFYAAAALPMAHWRRLDRISQQSCGEVVPMISAWGATETAPVATAVHFPIDRTSMIGLPVPGCEIRLVPSDGKLELRVRGPNITPGYWRRDDLSRTAFDEDGFLRIGDAGRLADPSDPKRGLEFAGRLAEDFKLSSGTWVNPGELRVKAISAGLPVIQDAVVTGHNRAETGLLIVASEQGCRQLCPDLPATVPFAELLGDRRVRQCVDQAMQAMAAGAECSSMHPVRALLMQEPLSPDDNEITDKGYVNQRAVLANRHELVERLYATPRDPEVITLSQGGWGTSRSDDQAISLPRCPGDAILDHGHTREPAISEHTITDGALKTT